MPGHKPLILLLGLLPLAPASAGDPCAESEAAGWPHLPLGPWDSQDTGPQVRAGTSGPDSLTSDDHGVRLPLPLMLLGEFFTCAHFPIKQHHLTLIFFVPNKRKMSLSFTM